MNFVECTTAQQVLDACNSFYEQLVAINDSKAISETKSMFNSIKGATSFYDVKVGKAMRGKIWFVENKDKKVIGLMRLKDEGAHFHLENLVGIPNVGGGGALLDLAKATSMSLEKELVLEAADKKLIKYYSDRCFNLSTQGGSGMVWKPDTNVWTKKTVKRRKRS